MPRRITLAQDSLEVAAILNPAGLMLALDARERAVERSHQSTWMIGAMGQKRGLSSAEAATSLLFASLPTVHRAAGGLRAKQVCASTGSAAAKIWHFLRSATVGGRTEPGCEREYMSLQL